MLRFNDVCTSLMPAQRRQLSIVAGFLAAFSLCTGCSSLPDASLTTDEFSKLLATNRDQSPRSQKVAIAPIEITLEKSDSDTYNPAQLLRDQNFQTTLNRYLSDVRSFEQQILVKPGRQTSLSQIAWDQGARLLLETTVVGLDTRFEGHHWGYYPNLLNWFMFMIPAWWVAVENYQSTVELRCRLRSTDSDAIDQRFRVTEKVTGRFDEFDRGWVLFGLGMVFSPSLNSEYNWNEIASKLLPALLSRAAQKIVVELETRLSTLEQNKSYDQWAQQTLSVILARESYLSRDTRVSLREHFAGSDRVNSALVSRFGSKSTDRAINGELSESVIRGKIKSQLIDRLQKGDRGILYLALDLKTRPQLGVIIGDKNGQPETVSFVRLLNDLKDIQGEVVLIVDHGLQPRRFQALVDAVQWSRTAKSNLTILAASAQEERVARTSFGCTLFAFHLYNAILGSADSNQDSTVTLPEIFKYVYANVRSDSGLNGELQSPWMNTIEIQAR